jgi:hypothetical protein
VVDRVYRNAWPPLRRDLLALKAELAKVDSATDWARLRIDPLLKHLNLLEIRAKSWEGSRLRGAVPMLHSDLVYFRKNIRGLRAVVAIERRRSERANLRR